MPGLRRCPWSQLTDDVWMVLSWWRDWKQLSVLPWGGNDLMDQPAYVVEAIRECENESQMITSEHDRKHHREMEHKQKEAESKMRTARAR